MITADSNNRAEEFAIDGMGCDHCRRAIESALQKIPGLIVRRIAIGSASVDYDPVDVTRNEIVATIEAAGYTVRT